MDWSQVLATMIRTSLIFFTLLILTRFLGKKQLSQLTFFNYVTGITIGSISAGIVTNSNQPYGDEFVGLIWWCILAELVGCLGIKSRIIGRITDGQPIILIKKGQLDKRALKRNRVKFDDLFMMLREKDVFSITDVDYAILETDGKLSVLKKIDKLYAAKGDLNVTLPAQNYLPAEIIVDGQIIGKNLKEYNLSQEWLDGQLKHQNISDLKEVLYAELQYDGTLFVEKY